MTETASVAVAVVTVSTVGGKRWRVTLLRTKTRTGGVNVGVAIVCSFGGIVGFIVDEVDGVLGAMERPSVLGEILVREGGCLFGVEMLRLF